jgi:hypothetical protein
MTGMTCDICGAEVYLVRRHRDWHESADQQRRLQDQLIEALYEERDQLRERELSQ